MSIEIPNFYEAAGVFDGRLAPTNPENPIFSSNGVLPFDPATTPGTPLGGFTRQAAGTYLIQLVQRIDFREGMVLVTAFPSSPAISPSGALLAPVSDDETDGKVVIAGTDIDEVAAADMIFQMGVFRITTGLDGTESP